MKFNLKKTSFALVMIHLLLVSCQKAERVDPIIKSQEAQNIGINQATMIGELQDMGARTNWDYGFVWSELPGPDVHVGTLIHLGNRSVEGVFSIVQDGLQPGTTYYFKSFVSDPAFTRIYYGNERDFTTLP